MKNQLHKKIEELKVRSMTTNFHSIIIDEAVIAAIRAKSSKRTLADNQTLAYFCVWGVRDTYGTGWIKGAFAKSIKERGPASRANQKIVACWMHDIKDPIGRVIEIEEDEFGALALIEWDDPEAVPNAKRAMSQLASGTINGWSFGFDYVWDKMEYDDKVDTIWCKEADLFEISPVTFASIDKTYTVRSKEDYNNKKLLLDDETGDFIKTLPRTKQLELRQIISKHVTLAKFEPDDKRTLELPKPDDVKKDHVKLGNLSINLTKL